MPLEQITAQVEELFLKLDSEIAQFQSATSLHCKWGCGKCCFKPDIEATILEFLPFALHVYREGRVEEWHTLLKDSDSSICLILNPTSAEAGLCSDYKHRGLICRLFGYSARTNKYGKKELVTCSIIKTEQEEAFQKSGEQIDNGLPVPVMNQYYMQLAAIDSDLSRDYFPINVALRKAMETVMHYYAYRDSPDAG